MWFKGNHSKQFQFFFIFLNNCILTVHLKLQWWSVISDKPLQKQSRLTFTVVLSILSQLFDRKCRIESLKETHHTSLSVPEYKVCILTTPCVFSAVQASSSRPYVLKTMYAWFWKKKKKQTLKQHRFAQTQCTLAWSSLLILSLYCWAVKSTVW